MLTDDTIRDAVSTILKAWARKADNLEEWTYRAAMACGVNERTFEKWMFAETGPSAANLRNLENHFGTPFKNETEAATGPYICARRTNAEAVEDANKLARLETAFTQIRGVMDDADGEPGLREVV